jgi:hypothetical protein
LVAGSGHSLAGWRGGSERMQRVGVRFQRVLGLPHSVCLVSRGFPGSHAPVSERARTPQRSLRGRRVQRLPPLERAARRPHGGSRERAARSRVSEGRFPAISVQVAPAGND